MLSDDAAERQQRPLAIGLGESLPESSQREALEWLRWARGGTERARWCGMRDLLGGLRPGVWRSNPLGSATPVRRLWAATMAVHDARLQVQSVCVFWQTLNKNVAALQDRGHVLHFQPGALRCIGKPAGGSTMGRFTAGLAKISTGCVSRRFGTMCGRGRGMATIRDKMGHCLHEIFT